ncbi:unnamed protein product [Parajaminaea phylloscopi]
MASTSSSPPPTSLKVLTLNVWGLAHISKARRFRIEHIADRIACGDWDIVALQEIWVESEDWRMLRERCSSRLPFSKFFYSGAFGSGLAILSRFRIVATHTHPYSLNGLPIHVGHGDWFVGKAAGSVTLDLGDGLVIDVFDTHTVAAGGEYGPEQARAHRIVQAWELAQLVQNSAARGRHVISLGDFNSTPPALTVALLRDFGGLSDAFLDTHPELPPQATSLRTPDGRGHDLPDPQRCIDELGVTCDSPLNTWTAGKKLDPRARAGAGKRLDYVFYRGPTMTPTTALTSSSPGRIRPSECSVVFTELIPGAQMSYTDHFGVEAVFQVLSEGDDPATHRPLNILTNKQIGMTLSSASSALQAYLSTSRQTQRSHILGFAACVTLALGLIVGTPFVGYRGYSFWAAIAVLLATAAGWGGTTLLYSGVIWGEWEKRAVRTVLESIDLALQGLASHPPADSDVRSTEMPSGGSYLGSPPNDAHGAGAGRPSNQFLI